MNDTIYRQDAEIALKEYFKKSPTTAIRAAEVIQRLQSAQPERTGDYKYESVKALDSFTKAFCRDDQVEDDLIFRCRNCSFEMPDKTCLVKAMAKWLCPEYKDFGSMGGL